MLKRTFKSWIEATDYAFSIKARRVTLEWTGKVWLVTSKPW